MIKAVIFDLDGVLLDSTSTIVEVFQEDARRGGIRVPSKKDVTNTLGLPWRDIVERLFGKDERYKKIHREVWAEYENKTEFMPGIKEMLSGLKQEKAVVTSEPKDIAKRQLKDFLSFFKFIVAEEDTVRHKPHPEPLLRACNQLNIKPDESVYISDSLRDFEMAKRAGAEFIGVLSGATSKEEFKKAGVKKSVISLTELLKIF